jgi:hypothetical protein
MDKGVAMPAGPASEPWKGGCCLRTDKETDLESNCPLNYCELEM